MKTKKLSSPEPCTILPICLFLNKVFGSLFSITETKNDTLFKKKKIDTIHNEMMQRSSGWPRSKTILLTLRPSSTAIGVSRHWRPNSNSTSQDHCPHSGAQSVLDRRRGFLRHHWLIAHRMEARGFDFVSDDAVVWCTCLRFELELTSERQVSLSLHGGW